MLEWRKMRVIPYERAGNGGADRRIVAALKGVDLKCVELEIKAIA